MPERITPRSCVGELGPHFWVPAGVPFKNQSIHPCGLGGVPVWLEAPRHRMPPMHRCDELARSEEAALSRSSECRGKLRPGAYGGGIASGSRGSSCWSQVLEPHVSSLRPDISLLRPARRGPLETCTTAESRTSQPFARKPRKCPGGDARREPLAPGARSAADRAGVARIIGAGILPLARLPTTYGPALPCSATWWRASPASSRRSGIC